MTVDQAKLEAVVSKYRGLTAPARRGYNEANTRKDFIEPLFEALGWDVRNIQCNEVDEERHVKPGFADYAFKLDGIVRFYLEAKALREEAYKEDYARQVMTYAYNKGVTWAVLCNFCTLQVFNAEWETTDLNRARVLNLSWEHYAAPESPLKLLSRDAFLTGDLEKHAETFGGMRPRLPVEKSLFAQLRRWRQTLFTQIANYRRDLTHEQVDEAVLRLLNRLIFIRNCEDRRIEEARLRAALREWEQHGHQPELVEMLRQVFHDFDVNYDSDLFNLALADQVFVESIALEEIIRGLYQPPASLAAYDFSVIDADVLGQVYEQYLGYVAREVRDKAEKQRRLAQPGEGVVEVELEVKRQRRKERGIYYTPGWVVDYIVRQTVGRYLDDHNHDDAMNLKILDPACGSGSFVIRAFDVLLDYHARIKGKTPSELDRYERWRILTGNIYGVDLDPQAVEIARLNLLLRAVARRDLLPSLADNIRLGNSLISGSQDELRGCFGRAWRAKRPFDWQHEFPDIMARGGFDIVIGNPPYVRIQTIPRADAEFYRATYNTAHGAFDLYVLFIERAIALLRSGGRLGFITSGKFLKSEYGERVRGLLRQSCDAEDVVDLSAHSDVFGEPTSYPMLLIARKGKHAAALRYVHVPAGKPLASSENIRQLHSDIGYAVTQDALEAGMWPPPSPTTQPLLAKIAAAGPPLSEWCEKIFVGLQTSADTVYILRKLSETQDGRVWVLCKGTKKQHLLEPDLLKPLLSGEDVTSYAAPRPARLLLFPYAVQNGHAQLITAEEMEARFPRTWEYLLQNKRVLESRERGKMRHDRWYAYVYPKNLGLHDEPKIAIPRLVRKLEAAYDAEGRFYLDNVDVNGLLQPRDPYYLLALLNSTLLDFYFRQRSAPFRGDFRSANRQFISPLPIKAVDPENAKDSACHDQLVALVERMLDLHQRLAAKGKVHDEERGQIEREIERTDREIDGLVYDLYGLTAAQRDLIERDTAR